MAMQNGNGAEAGREQWLANGLAYFSIGLGVAELIAPGKVADLIGVGDDNRTRTLLRTYGIREIAAGIGILSQQRPAGWVWGRVAGDVLDLASLGSALTSGNPDRTKLLAATAAVAGITALDVLCGTRLSAADEKGADAVAGGVHVTKALVINRPVDEIYRFWHNLENLPKFMDHIESVEYTGNRRSHWKAKGPAGVRVEWDAEMGDDEQDALIAWRSLDGSDVHNSGTVRFSRAPGGRGTIVSVELNYDPPGGAVGAAVAKLFGSEPGQQIESDLRKLKQILEVGEVVHSDASIHSGMHAARPPKAEELEKLRSFLVNA
jgi:uncharacterized membrane protein